MAEQVRDFSELKSTLIKAPVPQAEAEETASENKPKIDKQGRAYATGKRKDAVLRFEIVQKRGGIGNEIDVGDVDLFRLRAGEEQRLQLGFRAHVIAGKTHVVDETALLELADHAVSDGWREAERVERILDLPLGS